EEVKGELRIDTPDWIRTGGDTGPVVVPGEPEKSSLYFLTALPEDDPDIMPSKGDLLPAEDQEILKQWILRGADLGDGRPFDAEPKTKEEVAAAMAEGEAAAAPEIDYPLSTAIVIPNPDYLQGLKDAGIGVLPVSEDGNLLEIDYSRAGKAPGELDLKELYPLARNIVALNLGRTKVSDEDCEPLAHFTNLVRLTLDRTNTGDDTLRVVSDLANIEHLSLFGTRVSDSGMGPVEGFAKLKHLNILNTMVSPATTARLVAEFPDAEIIAPE
ncbi:MAG: c-type cytochrome domain-containing protein, partial [Verrucomicrobiales bacterium]